MQWHVEEKRRGHLQASRENFLSQRLEASADLTHHFDGRSKEGERLTAPNSQWALPPLISGDWRDLNHNETEELGRRLAAAEQESSNPVESIYIVESMRMMRLPCYRQSLLIEVQAHLLSIGRQGLCNFIYSPLGLTLCNKLSLELHDINDASDLLQLDTAERALSYTRLFCNIVHGDEGRFRTVETAAALPSALALSEEEQAKVASTMARLHVGPLPGEPGQWKLTVPVFYAGALFVSDFQLNGGMIEMVDDTPIEELQLLSVAEEWHCQFRLVPQDSGASDEEEAR
jgi:hypothetical protein